jgi:hypothetical protein
MPALPCHEFPIVDKFYHSYIIEYEENDGVFIEKYLLSNVKQLDESIFPKTVHVDSDSIQAQILNSKYSQCLLVFSPNIKQEKYLFREIDTVNYVPLLNNIISHINIKLLDSKQYVTNVWCYFVQLRIAYCKNFRHFRRSVNLALNRVLR